MRNTIFESKRFSWKNLTFSRNTMGTSNFDYFLGALVLIVIAGIFAGLSAWFEQNGRIYGLDIDGWGHLINRLKNNGHDLAGLFQDPSMFRGPVIPFLFGLSYYIAPFEETVLVLNVIAFSFAVGLLFIAFCHLGGNHVIGTLAILFWLAYLYAERGIFGYYYGEPIFTLLSSFLFLTVGMLVIRPRLWIALISGGTAGLLLLSRSPFLLVVSCIPFILWFHLDPKVRKKVILLFTISFILVFSPWTIRNLIVHGEFVPFTTQDAFQGFYLKGDSMPTNYNRTILEFKNLEGEAKKLNEIERQRYWFNLSFEQIKQNPIGQVRLIVRKTLRFWVYLPPHSWVPTLKTFIFSIIFFPLFCYGIICFRKHFLVHLCTMWFVCLWFVHAMLHTELRYNFPVMPMMFVLAIVGLFHLLSNLTKVQINLGVFKFGKSFQDLEV